MTNEKPNITMNLPDVGLRFNAQRVGPTNFSGLRHTNYGKKFRMPTIPEIVPLVYASLKNKNHDIAKNVVKTLKKEWIAGNTGILYVPEGMFVQDNPELEYWRISMDQKTLQSKLGSHEERGVVFSDDNSIRFTPYNFKRRSQTALELSINKGIIAIVGGEENAEKIAKASEHYRKKPYFRTLENVNSPQTKIVDLDSYFFGSRLDVDANDSEDDDYRFSFGVQEIKQEGEIQ